MKNEMGRAYSTYGREERCIYMALVGKPEGKKLLGRSRLSGRIIVVVVVV
jgi:hypothetical protein